MAYHSASLRIEYAIQEAENDIWKIISSIFSKNNGRRILQTTVYQRFTISMELPYKMDAIEMQCQWFCASISLILSR